MIRPDLPPVHALCRGMRLRRQRALFILTNFEGLLPQMPHRVRNERLLDRLRAEGHARQGLRYKRTVPLSDYPWPTKG